MKIVTYADTRTTLEARRGVRRAFVAAFRSGAVTGFLLAANGLLVLYIAINLFKVYCGDDWEGLLEAITGSMLRFMHLSGPKDIAELFFLCYFLSLMANIVVMFDFDKTIIDCDSDNWVIDDLGGTQLFDELLKTMPWNSAMDTIMREFHSQGRTVEEITESLKRAPLPINVISAIKSAYALGCELRIVSDANRFFIETILKDHELINYFSEINTNPSYVDEEGRLRIFPYHDFNSSTHGCSLCPPNMCKSAIIKRIQATTLAGGKKRLIYLGDGKGDYCPSLKLNEEDFVMPRKNYPLWDLIVDNPQALRAEIHEWSNAEELERVLLQLISESVDRTNEDQLKSADCKFHTLQLSSHEALPKALPVPN
ncbi:hypothetical protein Cni_G16937 [Canna indica]|uniref:Inorganic pyrophosphatase 2 n=1 Tax=Canna indica TaxID=4628 RepID=A0AAQ3KG36_9LILI|nr:hypothetical protein Cni_G16937 [Canna indica]